MLVVAVHDAALQQFYYVYVPWCLYVFHSCDIGRLFGLIRVGLLRFSFRSIKFVLFELNKNR